MILFMSILVGRYWLIRLGKDPYEQHIHIYNIFLVTYIDVFMCAMLGHNELFIFTCESAIFVLIIYIFISTKVHLPYDEDNCWSLT
jgi:hypothetical protein